jgi:hypothetical protein
VHHLITLLLESGLVGPSCDDLFPPSYARMLVLLVLLVVVRVLLAPLVLLVLLVISVLLLVLLLITPNVD